SGTTRVGRLDDDAPADIRLSGENILPQHCYFENKDGVVTLHPTNGSLTMVNGIRINKPKKLRSGFRVILGDFHIFRFNNPDEVRRERAKTKLSISLPYNSEDIPRADIPRADTPRADTPRADPPTSTASHMSEAVIDWNYAKKETALNYMTLGPEVVGNLPDEDLQRLAEDIKKIQVGRR
ncbi:10244_t:CDS:1, partial [Paraglomus occultum]